ncbi:MAG: AprI/Inh family metalloprotease inhibitor [Beijerinckiaceae bacterium]
MLLRSMTLALGVLTTTDAVAQTARPAAPPATAPAADDLFPLTADVAKTVAGQWDISVPKNNLKCRIQLNITGKTPKASVGMPAPCRKSLAAVGTIQSWGLTTKGALRLIGAKGETVTEFTRGDAGVMKATLGANDFVMEPVSGRYPSPERIASVDAAVTRISMPAADNPTTPVAVAGRYQLFRANNADTGCVLILDRTLPGPVSMTGKASLEKGCADKGLQVFDPAGWIVERDRMFLFARKGHRSGFYIERDGRLVKDPPAGSPLSARKL